MEPIPPAGGDDPLERLVRRRRREPLRDEPEALRDPLDVRVDGQHVPPEGVHHDAAGGLHVDARHLEEDPLGLGVGERPQRLEREVAKAIPDPLEGRLDPGRLLPREAPVLDRLVDDLGLGAAEALPAREAAAERLPGARVVLLVGLPRERDEDQLLEGVLLVAEVGRAVEGEESLEDREHPPSRRPSCLSRRHLEGREFYQAPGRAQRTAYASRVPRLPPIRLARSPPIPLALPSANG